MILATSFIKAPLVAALQVLPMEQEAPNRATRLRLKQLLTVRAAGNQQVLGRLVDISLTGMMLISGEALPVDQEYLLEIRPPDNQEAAALTLTAVSVWCRNNPNNLSHYGIGFRFSNTTADTVTLLEKLMQNPGIAH